MPTYDDSSLFYNSTAPYVGNAGDIDISTPRTESEILQPAFIRRRFAYRTPMSSLKFNQDASAFRYDIVKLYKKSSTLQEMISGKQQILLENNFASLDIGISWGSVLDSLSLVDLSTRLDALNARAERLERNN
jgi:hypothetical protein